MMSAPALPPLTEDIQGEVYLVGGAVRDALLGLPVPVWHHHGLIEDESGKRLAKRHDALSLRALREVGKSPAEVRALAGFPD